MRIFSKFRDYYDNVGFYSEDDRVWRRVQQHAQLYKYSSKRTDLSGLSIESDTFLKNAYNAMPRIRDTQEPDYVMLLGFCGRLYSCICHYRDDTQTWLRYELHSVYDDFSAYECARSVSKRCPATELRVPFNSFPISAKGFTDWRTQYSTHPSALNVFIELHTPIFIVKHSSGLRDCALIVNPCLKDYKLQSIFHPYVAHQAIDTFLNNDLVMCTLKDFEMSDELKRDSKGFDNWTFKQKGPKARKRKR